MRIAHFTEAFSPLSETFIYNLVVGLQELGHDSHVVTLRRLNEVERPHDAVTMLELPPRWAIARLSASLKRRWGLLEPQEQVFAVARKEAWRLLKDLHPDVIHAHFGPMGVMIAPVAQQLQIPLVVSFMGYDASRLPRHTRWKKHYTQLARTTSAVIAISNHIAARLVDFGFHKETVHRIPLGVDLSQFVYSDPSQRFDGRHFHCLHVGRLVPKKNPVKLVEAIALARNELVPSVDVHLTVIGDGPLYSSLSKAVYSLRLENNIHILGAIPHEKMPEILDSAHAYTQYCETDLDGEEEGQGVSFVEASAKGLPIVTTRHNGIPDVVLDGKTGYLVEENDIQGMAARIVQLAQNPALWTQFGRAGRAHVEANFTLEKQLNKTIELYQSLLK